MPFSEFVLILLKAPSSLKVGQTVLLNEEKEFLFCLRLLFHLGFRARPFRLRFNQEKEGVVSAYSFRPYSVPAVFFGYGCYPPWTRFAYMSSMQGIGFSALAG